MQYGCTSDKIYLTNCGNQRSASNQPHTLCCQHAKNLRWAMMPGRAAAPLQDPSARPGRYTTGDVHLVKQNQTSPSCKHAVAGTLLVPTSLEHSFSSPSTSRVAALWVYPAASCSTAVLMVQPFACTGPMLGRVRSCAADFNRSLNGQWPTSSE